MVAGYSQYDREEDNRERKPEQEADIGRAPNAERTGQLSLHRVARDLAERGRDGEGDPERGDGEHVGNLDRLEVAAPCRARVKRSTSRIACDTTPGVLRKAGTTEGDRKSTRLNSSH